MTTTLTILLIVVVLAWAATAAALLWARRRLLQTLRSCRRTGQRVAEFWHERLTDERPNEDWAESFAHLCHDLFGADGCLVYREQEKGEAAAWVDIQGAAGTCREWPLVARSVSQAEGIGRKLFYWSRRPVIYDRGNIRDWAPAEIAARIRSAMLAPLAADGGDCYVVLSREDDEAEPFDTASQDLFVQVVHVSEMALSALAARRHAAELEQALHSAHEEGMLQISTGIVHNIGNAVTVIQLAMEQILESGFCAACTELTSFISNEILPELHNRLSHDELEQFLTTHPEGRGYLEAIDDIMTRLRADIQQHNDALQTVTEKFRTVSELIALQQQFVGELGTENVVKLEPLLADVATVCRPPVEQLHIDLEIYCQASGRVLVDPAMLRHILMTLIKHAIDAVAASRRNQPRIAVTAEDTEREGRPWQRILIRDNGIGCDFDIDDEHEDVERSAQEDERRQAMLFARRRIRKYGGTMSVGSDYANGTEVSIFLPVYADARSDAAD